MSTESHLPTPADRPTADVVIYDGNCQFCTRQVERLRRWDHRQRLAFLSLHDPQVSHVAPNLSHDQMMEQMYLIDGQGKQHAGAKAIRYLSTRLRPLWPLAPLLHIPFSLPLWQWAYGQVARRRYQMNQSSCESGTCHLHYALPRGGSKARNEPSGRGLP